MDTIRFSILLSLLLFGVYANDTAKQFIKERRLNNMRLVKVKDGMTDENYIFVRRALDIHKAATKENGSVLSASLIVKDGKVVGEGSDKATHFTDPSAHAAMTAVREARKNMGITSLKGGTIYSTTELCLMCVSLLYGAEIDKIVYSIPPDKGRSADAMMIEKIYGALEQKRGERSIPEIFVPYQVLEGTIRNATDGSID